MTSLVSWLALLLALVALIVGVRGCPPRGTGTDTARDECDRDGWDELTACLVPTSDPRHDPARRLGESDCYWAREGTKDLRRAASGTPVRFDFHVLNRCAVAVDVRVAFAAGDLGFSDPQCGAEGEPGEIGLGQVTGRQPVTFTCATLPYEPGPRTRRRTYTIHAVSVNGAAIDVPLDPEIVLERTRN